jgi:hypothetical protein
VFNLRICAYAAGGAFLLSALAGLIGGADLLTIALRAGVFAAVSFGFTAGAQQLVSLFLPELLGGGIPESPAEDSPADEAAAPERVGEQVDVSVGDEEDEGFPQFLGSAVEEKGEETILAPAGLDQRTEGGYTEVQQVAKPSPAVARTPSILGDVDVLPDLEGFADSFVNPISVDQTNDRPEPRQVSSSSSADGGRFDPKEMAMAIQTILKRDQKG